MALANGVHRRVSVGDLRTGDHACLLFGSDEEQLAVLRGFVIGGLQAEHKILYLSDPEGPRTSDELLKHCRLTGAADGLQQQIDVVDAMAFCVHEGRINPQVMIQRIRVRAGRAKAQGYRALRIAGEMSAAAGDEADCYRLLRYEALLAHEFRSGDVLAVCQYDVRRCDAGRLAAFRSAHPRSVEGDPLVHTAELLVTRTYRPEGLRIEGVVDLHTHRHLRAALQSIAAVESDVRLEMSGVEFLDIGGLRLLMAFARSRADRYSVELFGLLPHLRHVISLIGWDETPGLRLGASHAY